MRQEVKFRHRRDTSLNWFNKNPVLANGEQGYEEDTGKFKIGNGQKTWAQLPYFVPQNTEAAPTNLADHIVAAEPHPVYDDGPSLALLYANAKV